MTKLIAAAVLALLTASAALAADTPQPLVRAYDALADAILGVKRSEFQLVRSILDQHHRNAALQVEAGKYPDAATNMTLFATEGGNAVAGIRKRLLEGGHHHNAEGEAKGIYEPGFVIVTRTAKKALLEAAAEMRAAKDPAAAREIWSRFEAIAAPLLKATD
jgi:opacity protein-like surface antigen